jgi:hypothetical protein
MDSQDMKQAGLAGEFLAENESPAPAEAQQTNQAAVPATGQSSAEESASAQKRANLVLAVLFLAGMALVYFMSMHDETTKANPLETASETIVNHAVQQFQTDPGNILGPDEPDVSSVELAREMITGTAKRQVPLKELKGNPFVLAHGKQTKPKPPKETKPAGLTPGATAVQRAEALQLQSIVIADNRSLAIISDRLLTVGHEIAGWRVHEIANGQVILKLGDLSYVLRKKQ